MSDESKKPRIRLGAISTLSSCCAPKTDSKVEENSCCPAPQAKPAATANAEPSTVTPEWTKKDHLGAFLCRVSNKFRMNYAITPGLYKIGTPDKVSDVFVTANYKFSFDVLRRELRGINAWILVLDTKGINVWCAAGKGTFGTDELVSRIFSTRLMERVTHRKIIVPQLGAVGIAAHEVKMQTGFHVTFGPIEARDIPDFITNNYKAKPAMRQIGFSAWNRFVLTPMELVPAMKLFPYAAAFFLIVASITREGFLFNAALSGLPLVYLALGAVFTGAFLTPLLLPYAPFRSFALKGLVTGIIATFVISHINGVHESLLLTLFTYAFFPAVSSYLALQFTGATAYTGRSGVEKELKYALPAYKVAAAAAIIILIAHKLVSLEVL